MTPLDARRPLLEHLEELRRRLWWCLAAVAAGGVATYGWRDPLLAWLLAPVGRVVFTSVSEPLMAELKLAAWGGLFLGLPVILWQAWAFVAAGLRAEERRAVRWSVPIAFLLFTAGAWGGVAYLVPWMDRFFLGFARETMVPMLSVSRYLGFVGMVALACGLMAQTPLIVAVLARFGVVTPAFLCYHWRGAIVGSFVIAAVATPTPDMVTQSVLAAVLLVLYGLSIGIAWVLQPRRAAAWLAAEPRRAAT